MVEILQIKKAEKNIGRLTKAEAQSLADEIARLMREAEQHFKSGESKLKTCAPLIKRMSRSNGERGEDGWALLGYAGYEDWAEKVLKFKYSYARTFFKAVQTRIELEESTKQDVVEFLKNAPVAQLAALGEAPEGEREKALFKAKELAAEQPLSRRIIEDAVEAIQPVDVEPEKLRVLTSEKGPTNKEWIKTKNAANLATLEAALSYWQQDYQTNPTAPTSARIERLSERIDYLKGKESKKEYPISEPKNSDLKAERQLSRQQFKEDLKIGGLLDIEDPETLKTYVKVIPPVEMWEELQDLKEEREILMEDLDEAGHEIVQLSERVKVLEQEVQTLKQHQKALISEWEIEVVDAVAQFNNRRSVVLN